LNKTTGAEVNEFNPQSAFRNPQWCRRLAVAAACMFACSIFAAMALADGADDENVGELFPDKPWSSTKPAAPAAPAHAPAWFLPQPRTWDAYNKVQAGQQKVAAQEAMKLSATTKPGAEKDELDLVAAIAFLKGGDVKRSAASFRLLAKSKDPMTARAAKCYGLLLEAMPDGKSAGHSLADFATFTSACQEQSKAKAALAAERLKQIDLGAGDLEQWRKSWAALHQAPDAFEAAGTLNSIYEPTAGELEQLAAATGKLAAAGLALLEQDLSQRKTQLIELLGQLKTDEQGKPVPMDAVAHVNAAIRGIREQKARMVEVIRFWSANGKDVPPKEKLAAMVEKADCLSIPATADGDKLAAMLAPFGQEVKPASRPASAPATAPATTERLFRPRLLGSASAS
jgi:hypothetical protein